MRAVRPLNRDAVRAANREFYAKHPEMIVNGAPKPIDPVDPKQASMRSEWMKSYARNGGAVTPARSKTTATEVRKVNSQQGQAPANVNRSANAACPNASSPAAAAPATPPPQPARKPPPPKPCDLLKFDLTCMHGRSAGPEGILMVVPGMDFQSSVGDKIVGKMAFNGGCADHAAWSVGGFWTSEGKGTSFNFSAHGASADVAGFFGLKHVSPHTYRVEGQSCSKGRTVDVQAYPSGKISGKVDFKELKDKISDFLKKVPMEDAKRIEMESKFFHGALKYEGAWKENTDWRACYESSITGGFDPLMAGSIKAQVYPPSVIPAKLAKYVAAGLFVEVGASASFTISYVSTYWPDTGKSKASSWKVSLEGGIDLTLSIEANLVSKNVLTAKVAGSTGGRISAERDFSEEPIVNFKGKLDGVTGKFTLAAAWGTIEINREYLLVGPAEWPLGQWHIGK